MTKLRNVVGLAVALVLPLTAAASASAAPQAPARTGAVSASTTQAAATGTTGSTGWRPTPGQGWQWVLSTVPTAKSIAAADPSIKAWDVDGFNTSAATVAAIHAKGAGAVCYFSAGSWEDWRPDAGAFPARVKGKNLEGWAGEKWLDVRATADLAPIMRARMEMCKAKGFDAVEPDNVDGYTNPTGFPLTAAHQLAYNRMLADTAHSLGLKIALKNDLEQVQALEPYFDFALNEECYAYNECGAYSAFRNKNKAVWIVEYSTATTKFCPKAKTAGYDAMKKKLELGEFREAC
ncbi:MAG: endo alpha-1,4 polygalactosaminidase [Actinomycetes bacterium]